MTLSTMAFTAGSAAVAATLYCGGSKCTRLGNCSLANERILRNHSPAELKPTGTPGSIELTIRLYSFMNKRSHSGEVVANGRFGDCGVGANSMTWR